MSRFYKSIIALLLLASPLCLHGQVTNFAYSALQENGEYVISIDKPDLNYKVRKAELHFKWGIQTEFRLADAEFGEPEISFSVEVNNMFIGPRTLQVKQNKPLNVFVLDLSNDWVDIDGYKIIVHSISELNTVQQYQQYLMDNLMFGVEEKVDYGIDVRTEVNGTPLDVFPDNLVSVENQRHVILSWQSEYEFPNYQVQLVRLYNNDPTQTNFSSNIIAELDWSKAVNVETSSPEKNVLLSLAGGSGYYAWRVRPLGTYYDGGIADHRNYGAWNETEEESLNFGVDNSQTSKEYIFYFNDPDDQVNYIYNRVFTENNKLSEGITYANGLNQVKQTQTYSNEQGKTIVMQSVLDYSGRPTLQTLPVPDAGRLNAYKQQFVRDEQGNLYTADNFDKDAADLNDNKVANPDKLFFSNGYYSDNTPEDTDNSVPDAEGFPYTRTILKNDGTDRAEEQSGVGLVHKIGGKTVKTTYSKPSDDELVRVFGDQALSADAVIKTETTDQNNVTSVTYTSNEGHVIATCLKFEDNPLLSSIDNSGSDPFRARVMTEENDYKEFENQIIFESSAKLEVAAEIDFPDISYYKECKDFQSEDCFTVNPDCGYELSIIIYEKIQGSPLVERYVIGPQPFSCGSFLAQKPADRLEAGTYYIKKILRANTDNRDSQVMARFEEESKRIEPFANVFVGWLGNVDSEETLLNFFKAVKDLRTDLEASKSGTYQFADKYYEFDFYLPERCVGDHAGEDCFDLLDVHDVGLFNVKAPDGNYNFDNSIDVTQSNEKPTILVIAGGCCGPIEVRIPYEQFMSVYTKDQLRCIYRNEGIDPTIENPCGDVDDPEALAGADPVGDMLDLLEAYLADPIEAYNGSLDEFYHEVISFGYSKEIMRQMLIRMVTDKYEVERTITDLDGNPHTFIEQILPYDYQKVLNAWMGALVTYQDILQSLNESPANIDVNSALDQNREDMNEDDEDNINFADAINDGMEKSPLRSFIRFIMRFKKIRDLGGYAKDEADESSGTEGVFYEANFVDNFMQSIGYKFTDILEELENIPGNKYNTFDRDKEAYMLDREVFIQKLEDHNLMYADDENMLKEDVYVMSPVFAYKYFEYRSTNMVQEGNDEGLAHSVFAPAKAPVELENCFVDFQLRLSSIDPDGVLCSNPCENVTPVKDWEVSKKALFLQDVQSFKALNEVPDDPEFNMTALTCEELIENDGLKNEMLSYRTRCLSACEEKRSEFRMLIEEMFRENCYEIGGCMGDPGVVTLEEIDLLVQEILNECSRECNDAFDLAISGGYPHCDELSCYNIDLSYSPAGQQNVDFELYVDAPQVELMPSCTWQVVDQVVYWEPVVNLDDASFIPSNCPDRPQNEWVGDIMDCLEVNDRDMIQVSKGQSVSIGTQIVPED
ncbi:hypothetical protein RCC89_05040 [Cytophagaceae bacterium ABcell3]|nr:hypothetical protein RCC89_05040 [Cytophagaceae bacterium ABcell3]